MAIYYEWDIEEQDGNGDIIDHHFSDKCPGMPEDPNMSLVLVRNEDTGFDTIRTWAYVDSDGKLPTHFKDAYDTTKSRVPKRFHAELAKSQSTTPHAL